MAAVFYFPLLGTPTALGNKLSFYESGTDVPLDVWTDSDLTIPWAQPIIFNAAAEADGPIYVSSSPDMKVVYTDENDVAIPGYPVDFVTPSTIINVTTVDTTVLTNAQILALPTTPVTLIAAPASGLRIKVFSVSYNANTAAGAYTNLNATYVDLTLKVGAQPVVYGPINDATVTPTLTGVTDLLGAASRRLHDPPVPHVEAIPATAALEYVQEVQNYTVAAQDAAALTITMDNNGSGALTGGNAANTLTVTVYYVLESV